MTKAFDDHEWNSDYLLELWDAMKTVGIHASQASVTFARFSEACLKKDYYININLDPTKEVPITDEEWNEIIENLKEKT